MLAAKCSFGPPSLVLATCLCEWSGKAPERVLHEAAEDKKQTGFPECCTVVAGS